MEHQYLSPEERIEARKNIPQYHIGKSKVAPGQLERALNTIDRLEAQMQACWKVLDDPKQTDHSKLADCVHITVDFYKGLALDFERERDELLQAADVLLDFGDQRPLAEVVSRLKGRKV